MQRGHPLRTLQPMPTLQRRFLQEGREMQAGWPCTITQVVPRLQAMLWQEPGMVMQRVPTQDKGGDEAPEKTGGHQRGGPRR